MHSDKFYSPPHHYSIDEDWINKVIYESARSKSPTSYQRLPTSGRAQSTYRDFSSSVMNTENMNDFTRKELSDTLAAVEKRMDKRIDRMAEESTRLAAEFRREMELRDQATQREAAARRDELKAHLEHINATAYRLEQQLIETKGSVSGQKYWLAGIGVAVVLGIMGANATIFSGAKSFFDGGVDQAELRALVEEIRAQSVESRAMIERITPSNAAPIAPPNDETITPPHTSSAE